MPLSAPVRQLLPVNTIPPPSRPPPLCSPTCSLLLPVRRPCGVTVVLQWCYSDVDIMLESNGYGALPYTQALCHEQRRCGFLTAEVQRIFRVSEQSKIRFFCVPFLILLESLHIPHSALLLLFRLSQLCPHG
jgi:hypothetical protein